jgi:hypothetical protein
MGHAKEHRWARSSVVGLPLSGDPEICGDCLKVKRTDGANPPCQGYRGTGLRWSQVCRHSWQRGFCIHCGENPLFGEPKR